MDIAIKQRLLGGAVLLAGAVLFLPMLLEGSGVKALQPPEIPPAPTVPKPSDLAPALSQKAAEVESGIAASHGEPTFYPVQPATTATDPVPPADAVPEKFHLSEVAPASVTAPDLDDKAAVREAAAGKQAADKAAVEKASAQRALAQQQATERLVAARAAADKAAAEKAAQAEKLAARKAAADKQAADKAAADKLAARKQAAEKAAADKANAEKAAKAAPAADPDPALPQAWVVQVARLSTRENAEALVAKLRAKGFRAGLSGADSSWRVTIGPELDKSVAESAKRRLASDPDLKITGWIQAYRP